MDGRFSVGVQAGFGRRTLALWRWDERAAGRWQSSAFCQNEVLARWGPRVLGQEGQLPHPLALNHQEQHSQGPAWDQLAMPARLVFPEPTAPAHTGPPVATATTGLDSDWPASPRSAKGRQTGRRRRPGPASPAVHTLVRLWFQSPLPCPAPYAPSPGYLLSYRSPKGPRPQ